MKKVILLLIDSIMPNDLDNAVKTGKMPALKFLFEKGKYYSECITAFPTMTASVDATLMTGVYPDQHKIPGLVWYKPDEKRLIDYVNGAKTVLKLGIKKTTKDVLLHLNQKHLNKGVKTIFEDLADQGKSSGSINFIIHRGRKVHTIKPPFLLNLVTLFSLYKKKIHGPDLLSIGSMHIPELKGRSIPWGVNQTVFKRYGINDDFAIDLVEQTIASGGQPDFLAIYLPDHDHYLHNNINQPLLSLEKVDRKIAKLLEVFGTWEKAIEQNVFIVIGDHGQTEIGKGQHHNIDLDQILYKYQVAQVGKQTTDKDDLIFANNERMTYIYPLNKEIQEELIDLFLKDDRIDFIAWKEDKGDIIVKNKLGGELSFSKNGEDIDVYGSNWRVKGDLKVLDITKEDKTLVYKKYPDALSRLHGALHSQNIASIVITAKPGFEFISKTFPTHLGGGSHGSLHYIDSTVPLIITGAEKLPKKELRIVDLKNYILELLNTTSTTTGK